MPKIPYISDWSKGCPESAPLDKSPYKCRLSTFAEHSALADLSDRFHQPVLSLFEGTEYIVLIENDEDADEVVILQINQIDEETEEYVSIDDEDTLNKVFELFKKKYEGDINFE